MTMAAKRDYTSTPDYWSVDPATFDMWVAELGYAAAGKLMAACAAYFLHGTEPDGIRLTKSARNMFEAERGRLDRRRALAMKGAKRCPADADGSSAADVDNSKSWREVGRKSEKSSGKTSQKPAKKSTAGEPPTHVPTSADGSSQQTPIRNISPNQNPQTPAPTGQGAESGGTMSRAEFAALAGIVGFDTPNAYGMGTEIVAGG